MPSPSPNPWLELDELCHLLAVERQWVIDRVQAGLVPALPPPAGAQRRWRFEPLVLPRLRSMRHTEHCFGAVPELAALVADLEAEIGRLRRRLAALGADGA